MEKKSLIFHFIMIFVFCFPIIGCYVNEPVDKGHNPGNKKYYYVNEIVSDSAYTYIKSKSNDFTLYVSVADAVFAVTKYPHMESYKRTVIETDSWKEIEDEMFSIGISRTETDTFLEACEVLGGSSIFYPTKVGTIRVIIIDAAIDGAGYR